MSAINRIGIVLGLIYLVATAPVSAQQGVSLQSFTLIDANTENPVTGFETISDGATIDLFDLQERGIDHNSLNIRLNVIDDFGVSYVDTSITDGNTVETYLSQVAFALKRNGNEVSLRPQDSPQQEFPYAVFGDVDRDSNPTVLELDYLSGTLVPGEYTLNATAKLADENLEDLTLEIGFSVVGPEVDGFTLLNESRDLAIEEGSRLDITPFGDVIQIQATTRDFMEEALIRQVDLTVFNIEDSTSVANTTSSNEPYVVDWSQPSEGDYILRASYYYDRGQGDIELLGTFEVRFEVIESVQVSEINLIDATSGEVVPGFRNLQGGEVINLDDLVSNHSVDVNNLTLEARLDGPLKRLDRVEFLLISDALQDIPESDKTEPYSLFGENSFWWVFLGQGLPIGQYTLSVLPIPINVQDSALFEERVIFFFP